MRLKTVTASACAAVFLTITSAASAAVVISQGAGVTQIVGGINTNAAEGADKSFDGTTSKYYNGGLGPLPTLVITPTFTSTIVTSVRIFTGNDAAVRDPSSFSLYGSNNGVDYFAIIENATITLPGDPSVTPDQARNTGGQTIDNNNLGTLVFGTATFSNTTAYTTYRFEVESIKGGGTDAQFGELQLIGDVIPEPTTTLLSLIGGIGFLARRRR